jgi:hypothetical protein
MRASGIGFKVKSAVLNAILDEVPKKLLYHYTDQNGLLGIIRSKEIWATHHQYLNDTQEFLYAKELVRSELEGRISRATDGDRPLLEVMSSALNGPGNEDVNLFVASFSEEPDSLPQWRAYGGSASGFATGFQCERLVLPEGFVLAPCIYDQAKQLQIVDAIVSEVLDRKPETLIPQENVVRVMLLFALHAFALILKHPKFAEEREWRIVSRVMMDNAPAFPIEDATRLDFRVGKSMLIPYRCVSLKSGDESFLLKRVVVGPNPNPQQARRSVRTLLNSKLNREESSSIEIQSSDIPYRTW